MPQTVPTVLKQENEIPSAAQDMEIGCLLYRNRENFAKEILSVCVFLQVAKEKKDAASGRQDKVWGEKRKMTGIGMRAGQKVRKKKGCRWRRKGWNGE